MSIEITTTIRLETLLQLRAVRDISDLPTRSLLTSVRLRDWHNLALVADEVRRRLLIRLGE